MGVTTGVYFQIMAFFKAYIVMGLVMYSAQSLQDFCTNTIVLRRKSRCVTARLALLNACNNLETGWETFEHHDVQS